MNDMIQERRILFFTAFPHHYNHLLPLISRLEDMGANLTFATTQNVNFGCDFKGDFECPMERAKKRVIFMPEQFEAEVANDLVRDYRRAERAIAQTVREAPEWTQHVGVAAVRLRTMIGLEYDRLTSKLLDSVEPSLVVALHEYNCWTRPLCAQAQQRGIPVLSFMEDMGDENLPGRMSSTRFSTKVCVWGQAPAQKLIDEGTAEDRIAVVGPMHLDEARKHCLPHAETLREDFGLPADKKRLLLIIPRTYSQCSSDETLTSLQHFIEQRDQYCLAIKWPAHDTKRLGITGDRIISFHDKSLHELIAASDVVLSAGTRDGRDTLAMGKPLIEVDFTNRKNAAPFTAQGLAFAVRTADDWNIVDKVVSEGLTKEMTAAVEKYIQTHMNALDGQSVDNAAKQVLALLS